MTFVDTMIVSTNVNRGHFGTLDTNEGQRAQAALSRGGGEAADRPRKRCSPALQPHAWRERMA